MIEEIDKYRNDPVLFAEEILGYKLFEYQKFILRALHCAKKKNMQLFTNYPYRNGRTMVKKAWSEFEKLR